MSSSHHHVQARGVEKIDSYDRDVNAVAREDEEYITYPEICQATERRLVRKLDSRLLPTIMIIFIINYMDVSASLSLLRKMLTDRVAVAITV